MTNTDDLDDYFLLSIICIWLSRSSIEDCLLDYTIFHPLIILTFTHCGCCFDGCQLGISQFLDPSGLLWIPRAFFLLQPQTIRCPRTAVSHTLHSWFQMIHGCYNGPFPTSELIPSPSTIINDPSRGIIGPQFIREKCISCWQSQAKC